MAKQSIFGRISTLVRANINALLDQAERARQLAGHTVFIGATAGGIDGGLATPASPQGQPMPAVDFHARTFEALRSGLVYVTASAGTTLVLSLLFLALPAWLLGRMPLRGAIACGSLVVVPPLASGIALNALQLWIPPSAAVLGFVLGMTLAFGAVLPTLVAAVLATVSLVLHPPARYLVGVAARRLGSATR